jgi:DNA mismatch repair protein MutS2
MKQATEHSLQVFPADTLQKLDFPFILQKLQGYCQGRLGMEQLDQEVISTDEDHIRNNLQNVKEFKEILENDNFFPEQGFHPLPFMSKAAIEGAALTETEFVQVAKFLLTFHQILYFFQQKKRTEIYPSLCALIEGVFWDIKTLKEIDRVIDAEKEQVRETASPELGRIRRQISDTEREQLGVFGRALRTWRAKGVLAEQEEGTRNGRRVLAVKAEHKRTVPGIYHDDSSNGSIAFIEPNETVLLNNELSSLRREEQREIERILRALTEYIRPQIEHFKEYLHILARYDAIRAKARLAIELVAIAPEISRNGRFDLKGFRHPVLYLSYKKQKKQVVENDLRLDPEEHILLISGPNAGGKSVVLKSAGLLQLMFQFGLMIPATEGTKLPVFHQLFADIGDAQSVENDLSTYSSHLRNMKYFTDKANQHTLILLDELGHGTDPALGGAMAEAGMDYLLGKKVYAVITTHYANLKAWGARTAGVANAAMSFDRQHLQPLYHLQHGVPGSSFTFEIAAKSGLNAGIIKSAKEKVGEQNKEMELSLAEIQHEKQYIKGVRKHLQMKEKQVEELQVTYERLKKDLGKEKKRLLQQFTEKTLTHFNEQNRALEQMMREWKEDKQDKEKFLAARKFIDAQRASLEAKLIEEDPIPELESADEQGSIQVGSMVKLEDGFESGLVKELRKNSAIVAFGNTLTHVKLSRLHLLKDAKKTQHTVKLDTAQRLSERLAFDINLDIRGLLKEEALTAMENFLDRALMFGCKRVRIIHGRGSGVLKQTVQHYLKRYPATAHFAFEPIEAGGDGVTAVDLK